MMTDMLKNSYVDEKQTFINLLHNARMTEITYSETYSLFFCKSINVSSGGEANHWITRRMNLIIDAPFWVGEKGEWEKRISDGGITSGMDDIELAGELVAIRSNNLIQVHNVEFKDEYVCITLDNEKILVIAYYSDTDYAWVLEEYDDKNVFVLCQAGELHAKNIPENL